MTRLDEIEMRLKALEVGGDLVKRIEIIEEVLGLKGFAGAAVPEPNKGVHCFRCGMTQAPGGSCHQVKCPLKA